MRLMICGFARCGSTSLCRFFQRLGLNFIMEPFNPGRGGPHSTGTTHEIVYVGDLSAVSPSLPGLMAQCDGIKHLWDHLAVDQNLVLLNSLIRNGVKVIHLSRRGLVEQALSYLLSDHTSLWMNEDPAAYRQRIPLAVITEEAVRDRIEAIKTDAAIYRDHPSWKDCLDIQYEDLYSPNRGHAWMTLGRIMEYVFSDESAGLQPSQKQTTKDVYQLIPNIEAIERAFGVSLRLET